MTAATCPTGKRSYPGKGAALSALHAARRRRRRRTNRREIKAYLCEACGLWHLAGPPA